MGAEGDAGADRVAGYIEYPHGRPGGSREPHPAICAPQPVGDGQRRVHQLLGAEHQHVVAEPAVEVVGDQSGRFVQGRFVGGQEPVPAGLLDQPRPHPALRSAARHRRRWFSLPLRRSPHPGHPLSGFLRDDHLSGGQRDHVDGRAQLPGRCRHRLAVHGSPNIEQSRDHVALPWRQRVQGSDRVERRPAGRELVVDQHDRAGSAQEVRVGGQHEVLGGVRVRLVEAEGCLEPRHPPPGRVDGGTAQCAGHQMPECGRRLRKPEHPRAGRNGLANRQFWPHEIRKCLRIEAVAQHPTQFGGDRRIDRRPAQELTDPQPEQKSAATDDSRVGGHMLGQHPGHQQVRPLRVDPQG